MNTDEVIKQVLPQFFPKAWLDDADIVFTNFPSRIRIGYVLRDKGAYSYIMNEDFSLLDLPLHELHAAALNNLVGLPSASISFGKVPGGTEGWISATDDNFSAIRILLSKAQLKFREALGDEFLLSIPHRDECFCWSLTQPQERQQKHIREALEDFQKDHYNLTPDIFRYSNGAFHLHFEQP